MFGLVKIAEPRALYSFTDKQTITLQVDNPIQTAVVSVLLMLFTFILKAALVYISKNHPCTEKHRGVPGNPWRHKIERVDRISNSTSRVIRNYPNCISGH